MSDELLHHFQSKQQSIEERIAVGKDLRKKFPRINQGEYNISADRTDPVSILEEQAKTRLPDLAKTLLPFLRAAQSKGEVPVAGSRASEG